MRVTCETCGTAYRNEAPLLVKGERDGKRGLFPPEPSADWWQPACRCRPLAPKIIETEETHA